LDPQGAYRFVDSHVVDPDKTECARVGIFVKLDKIQCVFKKDRAGFLSGSTRDDSRKGKPMPLTLRQIDPRAYAIARMGDTSILYEELMWFATADDRLLGLLLRDKIDSDYSWVVFARSRQNQYRAIDLGVSARNLTIAERKLTDALER
jgi:hypothetical protein